MVYQAIGLMSGSSMDGLDIAHCELTETGGLWSFHILHAECIPMDEAWRQRLHAAPGLGGRDLLLLHTAYGKWLGEAVAAFIDRHQLHHKIHIVASHGHTVFHDPAQHMTFQLGDGAAVAAITGLPVVSDLRNLDIALGGQGAPIIPIGEKYLWPDYRFLLNLGGICNLTVNDNMQYTAFDVCAANRVLNMLAAEAGLAYDAGGKLAAGGTCNNDLLNELNALSYYDRQPPKSLSNEFGTETVFSILSNYPLPTGDKLNTYCHHIAAQVARAIAPYCNEAGAQLLLSGGGTHNTFLVACITEQLRSKQVDVLVPDTLLIDFKEALVMAVVGVLRWREEVNVLSSVTGATRSSVGGALWMGQD